MTTTVADSILNSTIDPDRDWRGEEAPPAIESDRHERFWLLDARRREETFASETAFLVSAAITIVLSGVAAYFYALWTVGPA
jgi:hypothetical protein